MKTLSEINSIIVSLLLAFWIIMQPDTASASTANRDQTRQSETSQSAGPVLVGRIEEYKITKQELEQRLLSDLAPDPYKIYSEQTKPADANSMLLQMLGEKAMIIDTRRQGLLKDETIARTINNFRKQETLRLWVKYYIQKEQDKITATEEEIDNQIKTNPKITREMAKSAIENAKSNKILDQLYDEIYKKSDVKKLTENFAKAIELHDKLLNHPKTPQRENYIRDSQVTEELTESEKNIVLASFSNGKVTLQDWFETLCGIIPPGRPKDVNTVKGVERLLDQTLPMPLIVAEVQKTGLDKDPNFQKQIRDMEDNLLLNYVRSKKYEQVKEPTTEQIHDFFNKNKNHFITEKILKIDEIWCRDFETASKVKAEISGGKDFAQAKKEYTLFPDGQAYDAYPGSEGFFWADIWAGEPNNIIGPVKGFHPDGLKWRIVKILEKKPGKQQEYTPDLENSLKYFIMNEISNKNMSDSCLEILKKYPYEIYSDIIKDIDLLNIK